MFDSRTERTEIMYKKALSLLIVGNLVVLMGYICVRELSGARVLPQAAGQLQLELEELEEKAKERGTVAAESLQGASMGLGIADVAVSGQRVVGYHLMDESRRRLCEEDMEALLRIVEAEAGSEDEDGRLLVANVVLNRVDSERFPETVTEVVFQRENGVNQFSPVANGRYYTVEVSDVTVAAVGRALMGENISEGALFFAARKYADSDKMKWFDENLTFLFSHGGHEFFK